MNWKRLLPLYLGAAIGPMGGIGIVTLIPVMARAWSVEFATASLAITFYMTPFIVIQLFSGSIAQVFDVRKTLLFGFVLYALGGVLCGVSPGLWVFLGGRIIQGAGAAFLAPIIMALIGEHVSEQHVGKAVGMLGVAYTIGVTLGPLISGFIEVRWGWPGFFYFLSAVSMLAGVTYLATAEPVRRKPSGGGGLAAIGPIFRRALAEPGVLPLSLGAFCLFIAYIGIMTFTSAYLKTQVGLPSDKVGLLISSTGFAGVVVAPIAGYLGDRFGRRNVFVGGAVISIVGLAAMTAVTYSYSMYFLLFLGFGTGMAVAWTTLNTMAIQISPAFRKPVTSVYNSIKFTGYALSPVLLSVLYADARLAAVQAGCIGAVAVSAFLVYFGEVRSVRAPLNPAGEGEAGGTA